MAQGQDDKLLVEKDWEEKMAVIPCVECGLEHEFINNYRDNVPWHANDVMRGALYCGRCNRPTIFVIKDNATTFLPGKLLRQNLAATVDSNASAMIQEALKCFYEESYIGVVAMCRSAIIEAILGKDIGSRSDNVPKLIEKAKSAGLVVAHDETRAIGAGLIAKEALHHMGIINEDDALFAIRGAVYFVNSVGERTPKSASQSGTGSNEH